MDFNHEIFQFLHKDLVPTSRSFLNFLQENKFMLFSLLSSFKSFFFQVFMEVPVPIIPLTLIPFHCFVIVVVCFPFCHDIAHLSSKRTLAHNNS